MLSQRFNARTNIWNLTQSKLLLTPCSSHFTDDDETRVYPYTNGELDTFGLLQMSTQVFHDIEDTQTTTHCPMSIVFVRLGIPKIHEKPISEQLGDMPIKACDDLRTDSLI